MRPTAAHVGDAGELHRRVHRLGARLAEEDPSLVEWRQVDDPLGQGLGGLVREAREGVEPGDPLGLGGDRLDELPTPVPDVAVPQRGHRIDVRPAPIVGHDGASSLDDRHELVPGPSGRGEGMEEGTDGHVTLP